MSEPALQAEIDAARAYEALMVPALFGQWAPTVADAAHMRPGQRVLDVACGLGYSSAVMAQLGGTVVALEEDEALTAAAKERLSSLSPSVMVQTGPLAQGDAEHGPYDAILVNGSIETKPESLFAQRADRGRLACVVAQGRIGRATLFIRAGEAIGSRILFDAAAPTLEAFRSEPGFVF